MTAIQTIFSEVFPMNQKNNQKQNNEQKQNNDQYQGQNCGKNNNR